MIQQRKKTGRTSSVIVRSTDRRVLRTRKAIRDAVLLLSQAKDFSRLTITAVAQEANIDRKTFYLHYSSVEEVVDEIIREDADRLVNLIRDEILRQGDTVDVPLVFKRACFIIANDFQQGDLVLQSSNPEMLLRRIEPCLVEAMIDADVLGLVTAVGPNLEFVVSYFCAGVLALLYRWMAEGCVMPVEEVAEIAATAVASGVQGFLNKK